MLAPTTFAIIFELKPLYSNHDYEGINLKSIWYVLENDIKILKIEIENILKQEEIN